MTEQEFRELEMKLWRELGEQRKRERELAREQAIKEQTREWLFYHNLIREGSE